MDNTSAEWSHANSCLNAQHVVTRGVVKTATWVNVGPASNNRHILTSCLDSCCCGSMPVFLCL